MKMYRHGQGNKARYTTAIVITLVGLLIAMRIWYFKGTLMAGKIGTVVVFVAFLALAYYVALAGRKSVDFLIDVEGELRKVTWSTRRELWASTWVVIIFVIMLGCFVWVADYGIQELMKVIL